MTRRLGLGLLWLALALAPVLGDDFLGPRVTLEGAMTLADAARSFGRQVGCSVQVPHMDKARADRTVELALRAASPTEARAEIERAYGVTLRRWWRGGYGIEPQAAPVTSALGLPLTGLAQGWTCWLSGVRITFETSLRDLGPDGLRTDLSLVPRIVVQAPSDAEGLRIMGCSRPRTTPTDEAEPDARGRNSLIRWNQNSQDPSAWQLEQPLPLPEPGATRLDRLYFDLHLVRLVPHRFVFEDLDQPASQTQSDADLDVTVKPSPEQQTLAVELGGQMPDMGRDQFQAAMYREGMIDTRLLGADGQILPANTTGTSRDVKPQAWHTSFTLRRPERNGQPMASRLELTVYLPHGGPEVQTVEFRNVPLPPLP